MTTRDEGIEGFARASERGLLRLMMKLPAVRGQLQVISKSDPAIADLLEAYETATSTLERLHRENPGVRTSLRLEYEMICTEIETEVTGHCLKRAQGEVPSR